MQTKSDGSLSFIVPVMDSRGANNWHYAMALLDLTIERALKMDGPIPEIYLAMSAGDEPPEAARNEHVHVIPVSIDFKPLPTRGAVRTDAVHQDMGERVSQVLKAVRPKGHVMRLDWDDLVSPRMTRVVAEDPECDGWKIERGFIFDQTNEVQLITSRMHQYCGSTIIMAPEFTGVGEKPFEHTTRFKRMMLGGHRSQLRELEHLGAQLREFPGLGVGYRRESGENTSASHTAREIANTLAPDNHESCSWDAVTEFTEGLSAEVWPG